MHTEFTPFLSDKAKEEIESAKKEGLSEYQLENLNKSRRGTFTLLAVGIIVALGALFASLAAYQVLPGGVNVFSQLGVAVQALGFAGLGLGTILILV